MPTRSKPLRAALALAPMAFAALMLTSPVPSPVGMAPAIAQAATASVVSSGRFAGADRGHRARGTARIVRRTNGDLVVQLRGFEVTGGPDLRVWVTDASSVSSARAARRASHVDLGALRSSSGNQDYVIPASARGGRHRSVVIWCREFGVLFASASLA